MTEGVVKKLNGYSGCQVLLMQDGKNFFVRKISKEPEYNKRLESQINKQILFNHPYIKTPTIIDIGFKDGLFYSDMDYVSGTSLNQYIQNNHPDSSIKIIHQILSSKTEHTTRVDYSKFYAKINQLINEANTKLHYQTYLLKAKQLKINSHGYCHGDLSLENIIIKNNEIYLIDFLDSFLDSQIVDISKIFMDLIYGWSWRQNSNVPFVKNKIILNKLKKTYTKEDLNLIQYFVGLHLFRIKPYVKTQKDKNLIDQSINHCVNHLKL